jgi:hypothetical protein
MSRNFFWVNTLDPGSKKLGGNIWIRRFLEVFISKNKKEGSSIIGCKSFNCKATLLKIIFLYEIT